MFPAMLMAHSEDYVLPRQRAGQRVPEPRGAEAVHQPRLRRLAARVPGEVQPPTPCATPWPAMLPETRDMNFTWEDFQARNDSELGNNFGNLINRVLHLHPQVLRGQGAPVDRGGDDRPGPPGPGRGGGRPGHLGRLPGAVRGQGGAGSGLPRRPGGQPLLRRGGALQDPQGRPRALRTVPGRDPADPAPADADAGAGGAVRHGQGLALAGHGPATWSAAAGPRAPGRWSRAGPWGCRRSSSRAWTSSWCRPRSSAWPGCWATSRRTRRPGPAASPNRCSRGSCCCRRPSGPARRRA